MPQKSPLKAKNPKKGRKSALRAKSAKLSKSAKNSRPRAKSALTTNKPKFLKRNWRVMDTSANMFENEVSILTGSQDLTRPNPRRRMSDDYLSQRNNSGAHPSDARRHRKYSKTRQ